MSENKGFFVALVIVILFFSFIIAGPIVMFGVVFFDGTIRFFVPVLVGIFFGWLSTSVMQKFEAGPGEMVWNSIVGSCGTIIPILSLDFISKYTNALFKAKMLETGSMGEPSHVPQLFAETSILTIAIITILFLASYNFFTIKHVYNTDRKKLEYYAFAVGLWVVMFLAIHFFTKMVFRTSF